MAEISKRKYSFDRMYPNPQKYNLKYWERMQKLLDAKETRAQSLLLRHKWIERQNKMNYQNEYDRLRGELSRQIHPGLIKHAIEGMMPKEKLDLVTQYDVAQPKPAKTSKATSSTSSSSSSSAVTARSSDADSEDTEGKLAERARRASVAQKRQGKGGPSSSSGARRN
jgi:hypothetical protein